MIGGVAGSGPAPPEPPEMDVHDPANHVPFDGTDNTDDDENIGASMMFAKMNTLLVAMETSKGNYDIDDPEIRWVSDRIEYWNSEERIMSTEEMSVANHYWKRYK